MSKYELILLGLGSAACMLIGTKIGMTISDKINSGNSEFVKDTYKYVAEEYKKLTAEVIKENKILKARIEEFECL